MKWKVLITCVQLQKMLDLYTPVFERNEIEITAPPVVQSLSESMLLEMIEDFDGVIAGDDSFTENVMKKGRKLRVIARWGVGVDSVDLAAAQRLGIKVINTPDVFSDEVADVVLGYVVLLARQLHAINDAVGKGDWLKYRGLTLKDKTMGVVGLGSIGKAVLKRAVAFGMHAVGCDIKPVAEEFLSETGTKLLPFEDVLKNSDFVSLNCNLTESNYHLFSKSAFSAMKQGAFLINTARGGLVDESELYEALNTGKLGGAALDVFETEPLPDGSPLRKLPNCIFGSHNSSNTIEAVLRVNELAIANLIRGLEGA